MMQYENKISERPSSYLANVYVDTANSSIPNHLANLQVMGADHVLFGTDSPPIATPSRTRSASSTRSRSTRRRSGTSSRGMRGGFSGSTMTAERQASEVELVSLQVAKDRYDVAILGGGLAGLSMAISSSAPAVDARGWCRTSARARRRRRPSRSASRASRSGAHYFPEVVGMRDHLEQAQLPSTACGSSSPRAATRTSRSGSSSGAPVYPRTTPTRSIAGASRTSFPARPEAGRRRSAAGASRTWRSAPMTHR